MTGNLLRKLTREEIAYEEMETELRTSLARNTELLCARREGQAEGRAEGRVEGRAEGRAEGRVEGKLEVAAFSELIAKLLADNRLEDLKRITEDEEYRKVLFEEYGIRITVCENSGRK